MDQVIAGRYALGPLVGTGGMAKVYAADDLRLHRRVAIKLVPLAATEPIARQRFVREARAAAGFTHPNAVTLFDAGDADGYLYLVMELVEGQIAGRSAGRRGSVGRGSVERHRRRACSSALSAAHAVGIVHRDVKPANILLGRDGSVKLADFGIAKRLDDVAGDVTMVGDIIGTPKYLAPELMAGHAGDARERRLRGRRRVVRDARRRAAVRRRYAVGDRARPPGGTGAGPRRGASRPSGQPGVRSTHGDGEGSGRPVRVGRGDARGDHGIRPRGRSHRDHQVAGRSRPR